MQAEKTGFGMADPSPRGPGPAMPSSLGRHGSPSAPSWFPLKTMVGVGGVHGGVAVNVPVASRDRLRAMP